MKNQLNKKLFEVCRQGLEQGVFCGVAAGVSVPHKTTRHRGRFCGGSTRMGPEGQAVTTKTLFDLASLTKPLCTTLCTLDLIEKGLLQWNKCPLGVLDGLLPKDKRQISLHHILNHSSGLPAYKPFFKEFSPQLLSGAKESLINKALQEPLEYGAGERCVYSDLGFILLGAVLEKTSGFRLDRLFENVVAAPLQLSRQMCFLPIDEPLTRALDSIAATEQCPWRKKLMHGEVHDEHSWLMGGVAGHAGLFGTIEGVMTLCEYLLDVWKGRIDRPSIATALLNKALTSKHPKESWLLGFDSPSPRQSSSGQYFSPQSVGHLGFSGTSFWIDPEKETVVVLLTNRIHPTRDNTLIRAFRPYFHDCVMETVLNLK